MNIIENRPRLNHVITNIARKQEKKSYRPRVSNAGSCPRALTYQALGVEPRGDTGRMPVLLSDGALHEDSTIEWLAQAGVEVILRQFGLDVAIIEGEDEKPWYCDLCKKEIPGNVLHGHNDGVIDDGNRYYLFEHKGLGDYGFENLDRHFPENYITQCCAYIKGFQNAGFDMTSALLLVKNKNNSDYRQIYIEYDSVADIARAENEWSGVVDIFNNVLQRLVDLHQQVAAARAPGTNLPSRPYDQESFECQFCQYNDSCWSTLRTELQTRSTALVTTRTTALGRAISDLAEAREEKLQTAEKEKKAKSKIHSILAEEGFRSGETEDYKFWLSPFDKKSIDESQIPSEILEKAKRSMTFTSIKLKKK